MVSMGVVRTSDSNADHDVNGYGKVGKPTKSRWRKSAIRGAGSGSPNNNISWREYKMILCGIMKLWEFSR